MTDAYERRCAVTGERALLVLEAAHIRPYASGGEHRVDNGLLLRSDVHALFGRGYMTVTPALELGVSRRIREDFENGRHYYALHGERVSEPTDRSRGRRVNSCVGTTKRRISAEPEWVPRPPPHGGQPVATYAEFIRIG